MTHAKNPLAFTQRELVEQAFANDNVVQEFEEEKREAMEEDAPKDQDLTLPGWGAWGGKGLKDRKNVVVKKALPGEGVTASKRKDAKLGNVIISEKRIKKVRLVNQQLLELYEL
jgi:U3 small nucleolar RNA-associated protein 14